MTAARALGNPEDAARLGRQGHAVARQVVRPAADARHRLRAVQIRVNRLQILQPRAVRRGHRTNQDRRQQRDARLDDPVQDERRLRERWCVAERIAGHDGQKGQRGNGGRNHRAACARQPPDQNDRQRIDRGRRCHGTAEQRRRRRGVEPAANGQHPHGRTNLLAAQEKPRCGRDAHEREHGTEAPVLLGNQHVHHSRIERGAVRQRRQREADEQQRRFELWRPIRSEIGRP
mgnify:CR=1 FL=1